MMQLLIITYYWPPSGGAAVQRWLSFANKLAEKGHQVHLLTVDPAYATYQLLDESLTEDVHPAINVHTTKTWEPFGLFKTIFGKKAMPKPAFANEDSKSSVKKVARFLRGNLFIPDPRKGWKPYAIRKAVSLIQKNQFHCIITAGPPHSTHFIGKALKEKFALPWIADFHDLWTDVIYYDMLHHLPAVKRKDASLERSILESVDRIITVGDKYRDKLLSKSPALQPGKFRILRIGYDEAFFKDVVATEPQKEFVITYTGTLAGFYQPRVFIDALANVVRRFPNVPFKLQFAGVLSEEVIQKIDEAGLSPMLQYIGYVSHKESVKLLKQSTIVLLVNPGTKDEEMVIPRKLYEYLAAGKPIINITKQGAETAAIINICNAGKTFDRHQQSELEFYMTELVETWQKTKSLNLTGHLSTVKKYSRYSETLNLEKIISELVES